MNFLGSLTLLVAFAGVVLGQNKIVCYVGNWSVERADGFSITETIDPFLCTHFIYAFMGLTTDGGVVVGDPRLDLTTDGGLGGYSKITGLRERNPQLKVMIAIGGGIAPSTTFSAMAGNPSARDAFVNNVFDFLNQYNFDGLDFDWEFPAQNGGNADTDKGNFVILLEQLRTKFDTRSPPFLLSAAVAAPQWSASQSYDIPGVNRPLDFINVMAYDFHGSWDQTTGINAPLRPNTGDGIGAQLNVDTSINYWLANGATASKLVLGMGMYGNSYTLADPGNNGVGAPVVGPGNAGEFSHEAGFLGYNEICATINQGGWTEVFDDVQEVPYMYKGDQWVGYDGTWSLQLKSQYVLDRGLGGGMVWRLDLDDFNGRCGGETYPLLRRIHEFLG